MEDAALFDDERLGGDVAVDTAAARQVRLALHGDVPLEAARDRHVLGPDVRLDLALRRQGDVAVGVDLSLHLSVDPQAPGGDDVAVQTRTDADDRDLTVVRHLPLLPWLVRLAGHLLALGDVLILVLLEDHRASTASAGAASA